jgi:hypothetical protein
MILGVEGIHTFRSFVMNDLTDDPRVKVDRVLGLRSIPELTSSQDKATGRMGMIARRSDRVGKIVTYEGMLQATNLADLLTISDDMAAAFMTTDEHEMEVAPHSEDPNVATLPTRTYWGRPASCDISAEYAATIRNYKKGWETVFSLILELSDPRLYHPTLHTLTDAVGPLSIAATNAGNCDTEAIITVNGANIEDLTLTNTSFANPKTLLLDGMVAGDNVDQIVIDSKRRRIRKGSGANLMEFYDPTSTWWDLGQDFLQAGANVVTCSGTNVADFEIKYYDADIA